MWTGVDGYRSEAGQTWTRVRKNVDTCGRQPRQSRRKQPDTEGSRAAAGREPQGWKPRASPEPPAGAAGTGGAQGRTHRQVQHQMLPYASGARRYLGAPVRTLGAPLSPHLHGRQAVFLDWGDPTTEAAKPPEAAQATRSGPVKAGPLWAACLGLDGAATFRRGAVQKQPCEAAAGPVHRQAAKGGAVRKKDAGARPTRPTGHNGGCGRSF